MRSRFLVARTAVRFVAPAITIAFAVARPSAAMPRPLELPEEGHHLVRYDDGTTTLNDFCPVRERPIGTMKAPVFVNGRAIGFC